MYVVVMVSELIKMVVCIWFIFNSTEQTSSGGKGVTKLIWLIRHSSKMLVVALCYLIMNVLSFLCFNYIGAGEFAVYSQLKILTTASFSTLILGSVFSQTKWRALMLLVLGCVLVASPAFNSCQQRGGSDGGGKEKNDFYLKSIGYLMTIVSVLLSGFVSIYFEKVVKSTTEIITIWERNFQLCFHSIVLCIVMNVFNTAQQAGDASQLPYAAPLSAWSSLTLLVAVLGAGNGLIVAATLKYADSILKVLAQSGAIIIATGLGSVFQQEQVDVFVAVGCLVAILSIMNYTFDATPAVKDETQSADAKNDEEKGRLLPGGEGQMDA
jgi:UDP-sugar transporter A1/2/3